jgi:hypothetical protein
MGPRSCDRGKSAPVSCFRAMVPETFCERWTAIEHGKANTTKGYSAQTNRLTGLSTSRAGAGKLPPRRRSQTNANK